MATHMHPSTYLYNAHPTWTDWPELPASSYWNISATCPVSSGFFLLSLSALWALKKFLFYQQFASELYTFVLPFSGGSNACRAPANVSPSASNNHKALPPGSEHLVTEGAPLTTPASCQGCGRSSRLRMLWGSLGAVSFTALSRPWSCKSNF